MKKWICLLPVLFIMTLLSAQELETGQDSKGILYNKELTFDFRIHTNGLFAFGVNWGKIRTFYNTRFYHLEFTQLNHPKEIRQSVDYATNSPFNTKSDAFIYGKRNNFYTLHFAWGQKRYFSEKANRKGVAVGMTYSFGPSLGLLKPYYLELIYTKDLNEIELRTEKYTEENAGIFTDPTRIYGGAKFTKGVEETKIIPGGRAKIGLHFDKGAFDEFVRALEVGAMLDVYYKNVDIMVPNVDRNQFYFLNLYLAVQLGRRS